MEDPVETQDNTVYLHPYENYLNPLIPEQWKPIKDKIYQVVEQTEKETLPDLRITNYLLEQLLLSQERFDELLQDPKVRQFFLNDFIPYICKSLLLNGHYGLDECLELNNKILMNSLKVYDTIFFEDNIRMTEMFKLVLDPGKNQYLKNNLDESGNQPLGYKLELSEERKKWQQELKEKDEIDCVRWDARDKLGYWSRGVILLITQDLLKVNYLNNDPTESKLIKRDSIYIAPLKSKSNQYEWRLGLKKGDFVDVIDTANVWYNSTILDIEGDECTIGFRIYNANGEKQDEIGKFTGWSYKFDEKINKMNPRIQPFKSMAKKYCPEASNTTEMFVEDQADILFEEENKKRRIYGITRPMLRQKTVIEMVQMLGERGFFEKIIKRISDQDNWCPIEILNHLLFGLKNIFMLYYRDFIKEFMGRLYPQVVKNILKSPESNLRNLSKQKLESVFLALQVLLKRCYSLGEVNEIVEGLLMSTVLILFKSSYLERKIEAIKQLDNLINMVEFQSAKFITKQKLITVIKEKQLFTDIFDLKQHTSVIQRSGGLVKLLLKEKQLGTEELEIMWRLAEKSTDCDMKQVVFKVLEEVSMQLGQIHLEFILKKVKQNLGMDEINLLYELSRFNIRDESDIPKKIANFLKDLMFHSKIEGELKEAVAQKFCGLMKNSSLKDSKITVLEECVSKYLTISNGTNALKVIKQLVETYPAQITTIGFNFKSNEGQQQESQEWTKGKIVTWLWEKQGMKDKLLENLGLKVEGVTSFLVYFNQLSRRMNGKGLLGRQEFERMWNSGGDENVRASEELMELMKEVVEMPGEQAKEVFHFFMEEVVGKENVLSKVGCKGFACFKVGFMAANDHFIEKEIKTIQQSQSQQSQQQEDKFQVKVDPNNLKWIDAVWKFLFVVEDKEVINESIKLLRQLYLCVCEELAGQFAEIRKQLMSTCLSQLKQAINNGNKKISHCFLLIKEILDQTECNGAGSILSHSCLIKGELMGLTINNGITMGMDIQKNIALKIFSNATVLELRGDIAQSAKCQWEEVNLKRCVAGQKKKQLIEFKNNGRTLAEIGIKNGETLFAKKREIEPIPTINLLTDDGKELIEKAKEIFLDMFKLYSTDGKMSMDQCGLFIHSCTNDHCKGDDHRVKEVFAKYDDDKDGLVNEQNFLQFYLEAAQDRVGVVWQNLAAHHIRNDLKKYSELSLDVVIDEAVLPRYLISLDKQWYTVLFGILENSYSENQALDQTAVMAWELLGRLPLSPALIEEILLFNQKKDGWDQFLNPTKKFQLLYTLSVMEFLMEQQEVQEPVQLEKQQSSKKEEGDELQPINMQKIKSISSNYGDKVLGQWRLNFLTDGGFQHLVKIFFQINSKKYKELCSCDKLILAYAIQILKQYMITLYYSQNKSIYKVNQLFRQSNLKLEELAELIELLQNQKEQSESTELLRIRDRMQETEEFLQLVKMISEQSKDLQTEVLKMLNVEQFEDTLTEIIEEVLLNSERFEREERLIIEFGLTCLLSMHLIFGQKKKLEGKLELLFQGLVFDKCSTTRKLFSSDLLIFSKYNQDFGLLFSELLVKKLNQSQEQNKLGTEFYRLVTQLLSGQMAMKQEKELNELFGIVVERLWKHQSIETTEEQDPVLVGYLNLLEKLCKMGVIGTESEYLEGKLFSECLFFVENMKDNEQMQVKCQATKTRELVAKLVLELVAKKKNGLINFLKQTIQPFMASIKGQKPNNLSPSNLPVMSYGNHFEKRSPLGYAGLYNPSCICYMNAMLQQFFMVRAFRNAILLSDDGLEPQIEKVKYCGQMLELDDNLLHQFQKMFAYLKWSERMDYKPYEFCYAFKDFDGMPVNTSIQQDTQEFLNMIFDKLENSLKGGVFENILKDIFGGKIKYEMICSECGNSNMREEDFYNLSLEVRNLKSIFESLDKLTSGEIISDYKCENCNKKVELRKVSSLSTLPNVLIVHLQRLVMNYDTMMNEKINSKLEFPELLDLQQYTFEARKKKEQEQEKEKEDQEQEQEQEEQDELDDKDNKDNKDKKNKKNKKNKNIINKEEIMLKSAESYQYKLKGVVVHTGTADFGHYYSYIEVDSDQWLEFNDSHIREFDKKKIGSECFGKSGEESMNQMMMGWGWGRFRDNSKNAYILVYEKIVKDQVAIQGEVLGVKDNIEFDKLAMCEPSGKSSEVWKDNYEFLMDHHLYSQGFVSFTSQLIALGVKESKDNNGLSILVDFLMKFLFEVACFTSNSNAAGVVSQLSKKLIELIQTIPNQPELFISEFMLKHFDMVITFLVVNTEKTIRKTFNELILTIINFCLNKYGNIDLTGTAQLLQGDTILWEKLNSMPQEEKIQCEIILFLDLLLHRIPLDVTKNYLKLESYFNFWYEFAQSGDKQLGFAVSRDLIAIFGDFLLQKNSPITLNYFSNRQQGGRQGGVQTRIWMPALEYLINAICYLSIKQFYSLTENDKLILKCSEFYQNAIQTAVSSSKNNIVGELIMKQLPIAPEISKQIIISVKKSLTHSNSFDEFSRFMDLIGNIVSIEDSEQRERIEMIFGIPQLKVNKNEIQSSFGITLTLDSQLYEFISPIMNDYYKYGLLSLLLINQQKWDYLALAGVSKLLEIALKNKKVLEYLLEMPPICLVYNRYVDWFQPFINNYIADSERNPNFISRVDIAQESQKNLETLLAKIEKEYNNFKSPFNTYIIGKSTNTKLVLQKQLLDEQTIEGLKNQAYAYNMGQEVGVYFEVYESEVHYAKGLPQNEVGNKIFPQDIMNQNYSLQVDLKNIHPSSNILNLFNYYQFAQMNQNSNYQNYGLDELMGNLIIKKQSKNTNNQEIGTLRIQQFNNQMQDQDDYQNDDDDFSQQAVQGDDEQDMENIEQSPVQNNPPPPPESEEKELAQDNKIMNVQNVTNEQEKQEIKSEQEQEKTQQLEINLKEIMKGPIIRQYIIKNQTNKLINFQCSLELDQSQKIKEQEFAFIPVSKLEIQIKPQTFEHLLILQRAIPFEKLQEEKIFVWPEFTMKLNLSVMQKKTSTQYYPYGQSYTEDFDEQCQNQLELFLANS